MANTGLAKKVSAFPECRDAFACLAAAIDELQATMERQRDQLKNLEERVFKGRDIKAS